MENGGIRITFIGAAMIAIAVIAIVSLVRHLNKGTNF